MRVFLSFLFLVFLIPASAQIKLSGAGGGTPTDTVRKSLREKKKASLITTIDQYRKLNLDRDTTYVDTSLTIQKEYAYNYLRKDIFGLQPYLNDGQTYLVLDKSYIKPELYPTAGYSAKLFAYLKPEDIPYYSVATPFTELYFKTTIQQGQSVDALVAVNVRPEINFSLAYKGLRSLGRYINQLSSDGNFRFTFSYTAKDKRYMANAHFMSFDFLNGENGGIINPSDFEGGESRFSNRERINVWSRDGRSFLKGKRLFLDHIYRINKGDVANNLSVYHTVNYETQFYEYRQPSIATLLDDGSYFQRYGNSYLTSGLNDQARYNKVYNRAGVEFENKTIGKFRVFLEDFRFNYYFSKIRIIQGEINDGSLSGENQSIGGTYWYKKGRWDGSATIQNSLSGLSSSRFQAQAKYAINDENSLHLEYIRQSSIPNPIYNLQQSSFTAYNWVNDFRNEKTNAVSAELKTKWGNASAYLSNISDKLYFIDTDPTDNYQIIAPQQYGSSIQYLNVKVAKEFKWWKLGLDNTVLFQQVQQDDPIMNVPKFTTRNTLYFSDYFFKKALYLQTGFIFNYFTKFYADDFNPVTNEFFVQREKEMGGYPMVDFFINARIKTCRIYFKAEHFNSSMTGYNYLTAPNYPYRDFLIRFGLEWNFFK